MRVRQKTVERFKKRIREEIFETIPDKKRKSPTKALNWLVYRINAKIQGLRGAEQCPWCNYYRVGSPRSWMAFFRVVTDVDQLHELDKWIRQTLYDFMYTEFGVRIDRKRLKRSKKSRLRSLVSERYRVQKTQIRPCLCDIKKCNHNIWLFFPDLYQGRIFKTLVQKRQFTVPYVDNKQIQVSVGKRQYKIKKDIFQNLWHQLIKGEKVTRTELEKSGIRNTSHIVALLAELPGIYVTYSPITLTYKENSPAEFLLMQKKEIV
jgi:hypothetical protein